MEQASRTAIVLAQFRAAHVFEDPEPIFEDTLSLELAGLSEADVREFFATNIPPSCAHVPRLFPCQRSRFVEEEVAKRVRQEAVQSTLTAVAQLAAPNSTVIASYGVPDDLREPASREFAEIARAWTAQAGEPQITWPAPAEIGSLAQTAGWSSAHSVDPASFEPWFANRPDALEPVRYEWLLVCTDRPNRLDGRITELFG